MPEVPKDLMRMSEVVQEFKPSRSFWDSRIARKEIQVYRVPGERENFLSRADVLRVLAPYPKEDESKESETA